MSFLGEMWNISQWLFCAGAGIYSFLGGLFPPDPNDDPNFYHWEINAGNGSYINILGFRKMLKAPTVIAQGMMSPARARLLALVIGAALIIMGTLGILHHYELPPFAPHDIPEF